MAIFIVTGVFAQVERNLVWQDSTRQWLEFVPDSYSADTPTPVLFCFHGLGGSMESFATTLQISSVANTSGWIVIVPQALNASVDVDSQPLSVGAAWAANVGGEDVSFSYGPMQFPLGDVNLNENIDDVGFVSKILDSLENHFNIDTTQVFAMGFSMGGFMCNKLAIDLGNRFSAVASVSGTIGHFQEFTPAHNVNVMHIHGTADAVVSYDSAIFAMADVNIGSVGCGAEAVADAWRNYNNCSESPIVTYFPDSVDDGLTFERYLYLNGTDSSKVAFIKVINGEHLWYDAPSNDISYLSEICKFFINSMTFPTNINEVSEKTLVSVYPNPASLVLNIAVNADRVYVEIYDVIGNKVFAGDVNKGIDRINISDLKSGVYVLKVIETSRVSECKFVKN